MNPENHYTERLSLTKGQLQQVKKQHYTERLSLTKGQLQQVKKQIFRISMLRLTLFIAGVAGIYFFFSQTPLLIVCICLTFLPLFILVKIHNRFFIRKEWLETQAQSTVLVLFSEKTVWQNGCKTICTKKLPSKNGRK